MTQTAGDPYTHWNPYAQGWVCPKCGGVMAPFMSVCAYCKPVAPSEPRPDWTGTAPPELPTITCAGEKP